MGRVSSGKVMVWALLAVPAAVELVRYAASPDILAGDLLHLTGEWSARLIIIALMLTPLALLFPGNRLVGWLFRHRRAIGVGAFGYAVLHLILYVVDMQGIAAMLAELGAPGIWTGWLAWLFLVPPALASNGFAMRFLRRQWKPVQRLVYPAAVLTLAHWVLVHDGLVSALVQIAPLVVLQALRLARSFNLMPTERKSI